MKKLPDLIRFAKSLPHALATGSQPVSSTSLFDELHLDKPLLTALAAQGYSEPTPIQTAAIPHILAGRDLVGCAQTGTGKTAAFALPILQLLSRREAAATKRERGPSALILAPTRELALQIDESFAQYGAYTQLKHTVIYGGVGQGPQVAALGRQPHIIVATPGRLLDLMNQRHISLSALSIFVLDEADRMLDMGFIHDIKKVIAALPKQRQTLLFSATMPAEIRELSSRLLKDPVHVAVAAPATTAETIDQRVYFVLKAQKTKLLQHLLVNDASLKKILVFTRTKHGANRVASILGDAGIPAAAIHGNKSQTARQRALNAFKEGELRVLVASDIAARGIDIDEISHVVNLDIPNVAETYVHRIGRTGRAKAAGIALAFCDVEERPWLRDIEKLIGKKIEVVEDHPFNAQGRQAPKPSSGPVDYELRLNPPKAAGARRPLDRRPAKPRPTGRRPAAHWVTGG